MRKTSRLGEEHETRSAAHCAEVNDSQQFMSDSLSGTSTMIVDKFTFSSRLVLVKSQRGEQSTIPRKAAKTKSHKIEWSVYILEYLFGYQLSCLTTCTQSFL